MSATSSGNSPDTNDIRAAWRDQVDVRQLQADLRRVRAEKNAIWQLVEVGESERNRLRDEIERVAASRQRYGEYAEEIHGELNVLCGI